jgi:hypothetical protein
MMLKSGKSAVDSVSGAAAQDLPLAAQFAEMARASSIPRFVAVTLQLGLLMLAAILDRLFLV